METMEVEYIDIKPDKEEIDLGVLNDSDVGGFNVEKLDETEELDESEALDDKVEYIENEEENEEDYEVDEVEVETILIKEADDEVVNEMNIEQTEKIHSCKICDLTFPRENALTRHMLVHNVSPMYYKCPGCTSR